MITKDWESKSDKLVGEMTQYCKDYQKKICVKCSKEERKRRHCEVYPSYKNDTRCDHMIKARYMKFRKRITEIIDELIDLNRGVKFK